MKNWSRIEKMAFWTFFVTIISIIVGVTTPEIRKIIGLIPTPNTNPIMQEPSSKNPQKERTIHSPQLENKQEEYTTLPNPEAKQLSLCSKYRKYSAKSWRENFLSETKTGTWHVFVASLDNKKNLTDANRIADNFRNKFRYHDFSIMPTANPQGTNYRYAIVIAEGLTDRTIANEIAKYARECGIAQDAYAYQQSW